MLYLMKHIVPVNCYPDDLLCTPSEILAFIQALNVDKASGPDGISARMLKAASITPSVTKLFNISIRLGRFPQVWKSSSVVPVPKSNNHREASNYRPISLLPIINKLLERHYHHLITDHLKEHRPLSNKQWGFQPGKSIVTSLLSVTNEWFQALEKGMEVGAVFFDLRKAFDTVPHQLLLEKLVNYGFDQNIITWVCSYLTGRKQHIVCGGESSSDAPVLSGVPQGSVLGPLLFLLYIDDIALTQLSMGSVINLFADDMLLYKPVKSALDLNSLQEDIDVINNWVKRNHLMLNPSKCKSMLISRKRSPSQPLSLILDESPLEHAKTFKYLGVLLSSNLSWTPHVEATCAKARKLIGLLYRRFYEHVDSSHLVEMYKIVVRPPGRPDEAMRMM